MNKKFSPPIFRFAILLILAFCAGNSVKAQIITTIAGNGIDSFSGDGGAATAATLSYPADVTVDAGGNVYIADQGNFLIRKVTPSGIIGLFAGSTPGFGGDGGPATAAKFYSPDGVAVDGIGNLYIADQANNRIRKVMPSDTIITIAGNGGSTYSGDGGPATAAGLNRPYGVAVDAAGNVYIGDWYNNCVRKVSPAGIISTIAGNGSAGYSGDGGAATAAELTAPMGVAVDGSGNVYIADHNNCCIRKVTPSGIISTFAGNHSCGFSGDRGPATAAQLNQPVGVAVDASDNVYIADQYNSCIRRVTSDTISTIAGTGSAGFSGDGGLATAAELNYPSGVATDARGNVYFADRPNHRIRKVETCWPTVAAIAGSSTICEGSSTTLTDTTSGGTWSTSTGSSGIATINSTTGIVTSVASGSVIITYIVTNKCGSDTATKTITIDAPPDAGTVSGTDSLCPGLTSTFTGSTSGGSWLSTNSSVANVNSTGVVTSLMPGTVNILYVVTNSCGSDTAVFPFVVKGMVDCPDAVAGIGHEGESRLTIYPNPNDGNFIISGNINASGELTFEVRDIIGRVVKTGSGSVINGKFEVAVQLDRALNDGYYYVRIFVGGVVLAKNFVVGR